MKTAVIKILLCLAVSSVIFIFTEKAKAATIDAASCSQADVQAAINLAANSDTVAVPSGSCVWTTPNSWTAAVTISAAKTITLQGQGMGKTIISHANNYRLIEFNNSSRITGFTFKEGMLRPTGQDWRIDHCRFESLCLSGTTPTAILPISASYTASVRGLIDNNQFHNVRTVASNGPAVMANEVWARPLGLGTADAVYVEDNEFTYSNCKTIQAMDSNYGGNYVFRYNRIQDANIMAHAVQGGNRASRKWEVYNNIWTKGSHGTWTVGFIRAGTGVWFNNSVVGDWNYPAIAIDEQRSCAAKEVSGKCDGTSPWDGNTPGMSGYPCRDQIGRSTDNPQWVSTVGSEGAYTQQLDPAYAWNNFLYPTENDRINRTNEVAFGFVQHNVCPGQTAHLVEGRDYYNSGTTPKPGYVPYTYPHPLRASADTTPPSAPSGLVVN
ncbi:MAG: hypothetical protein WCV70_04240 [Patescibacteria group bacterium]|jgi:hypothetical protein